VALIWAQRGPSSRRRKQLEFRGREAANLDRPTNWHGESLGVGGSRKKSRPASRGFGRAFGHEDHRLETRFGPRENGGWPAGAPKIRDEGPKSFSARADRPSVTIHLHPVGERTRGLVGRRPKTLALMKTNRAVGKTTSRGRFPSRASAHRGSWAAALSAGRRLRVDVLHNRAFAAKHPFRYFGTSLATPAYSDSVAKGPLTGLFTATGGGGFFFFWIGGSHGIEKGRAPRT